MQKMNTDVEKEWAKEVTIYKRNGDENTKNCSVFIVTEEVYI